MREMRELNDARAAVRPRAAAAVPAQRVLVHVLWLSALVIALVAAWVLVWLDGWTYYTTSMSVRGYTPPHALLKPSGSVAHPLGIAGVLLIFLPIVYSVRKKWRRLSGWGSMRLWLDVHIFGGIVGPALVVFHTAFKFNGIISVAFWSMVLVAVSGFVGRYLYVRIPKTIRGTELTYAEIQARADELQADMHSADPREVARLARERAWLVRRLAYLDRTKRLFAAWHVFHQPLVYVMLVIACLHVAVALYFGYWPF